MRPDLLDHRQREAASILLAAVDLPQEGRKVARLWMAAARVCPGISVEAAMLGHGRRASLRRVRELVDQMLRELE